MIVRAALAAALLAGLAPIALAQEPSQAADSYFVEARADLEARLNTRPIAGRARNIILFIGDGMGVSTLTAARIHQGQLAGQDGESTWTAMDRLPYSALVRTYAHDAQVSDSAPTATAMVAGVKTRNDIIGLDQTVALNDCAGSRGREVQSIFAVAEAAGMRTGVVSTARITHATPAAAYAHIANRDWENSSELPAEARAAGCVDIARQMIEWPHGDGLDVILGGGRSQFLPTTTADPEDTQARGLRDDGRDLTSEWQARHPDGRYVWNAQQFAELRADRPVLGLFERDHMEFEAQRTSDAGGEPSLTEMTLKALDILEGDEGYILMVEAGRIDHAHHLGAAALALRDTVELDRAVAAVMARVDLTDTLVIVTADHSHNFTMAGYPQRGNPILGLVVDVDGDVVEARDGHPYTTLAYANGPGAVIGPRPDPSVADTTAITYQQQALVPLGSASHGGEDVAVRAAGPWAHLFQGTIEQHLIYHVMRHAMRQPESAAEPSTD